jgi:hypothetical protein
MYVNARINIYAYINTYIYQTDAYVPILILSFTQMVAYAYFFVPCLYPSQWLYDIHLWTFLLFEIFLYYICFVWLLKNKNCARVEHLCSYISNGNSQKYYLD